MSETYREDRIQNLLDASGETLTSDESVFFETYVANRKKYNHIQNLLKTNQPTSKFERGFVKMMDQNRMEYDAQIKALWRRLVDTIIFKDPNWGQKCQHLHSIQDNVQKVMWSDFCLRMQKTPMLTTIPKGTRFNHTTPCKFAHGRRYPYALFNFYADGEDAFMPEGVTYLYETKRDIPNVMTFEETDLVPAEDLLAKLDEWLKEWDPEYKTNWEAAVENQQDRELYEDYRQSAYICQVLGWNGIQFEKHITMLCGNGSKWMRFLEMQYNEEDVDECKDYSGEKLPRGFNSPPNPKIGQEYFEKEDALKRRDRVMTRSQFYRLHPGEPYYDVYEANTEQ